MFRWRQLGLWFSSLFALALVFTVVPTALLAKDNRTGVFREIGYEIIKGIDQTGRPKEHTGKQDHALRYFQRAFHQSPGEKLRVAIWPYDGDEVPIPKEVAEEFNDRLLAELHKLAGRRYDFVARKSLKILIDDMDSVGALDASSGNPINALMKKAGNIHFLISGKIRRVGPQVNLTYKATRTDGVIAATTTLRSFPYSAPVVVSHSLNQVVEQASRHFADSANDMDTLVLGGIRYGDSGAQPPFGVRLQGLIVAGVQKHVNNNITGRKLRVKRLKAKVLSNRGLMVDPRSLANTRMAGGKGTYVLSGTYWELMHSVEIKLRLRNQFQEEVSWIGHVRLEDTQGSRLRPGGDLANLPGNDLIGPFAFHLTTERGKDPAYKVGEPLNLMIQLDKDAWVYCFYRQSDASMIQIFPNPYMGLSEPRLEGGILHTLPGKKTFPFSFKLTKPIGYELLKCFAASRNITDDLPKYLRGQGLKPLPLGLEHRLSGIFKDIPDVVVSEQSLVVTVMRQE